MDTEEELAKMNETLEKIHDTLNDILIANKIALGFLDRTPQEQFRKDLRDKQDDFPDATDGELIDRIMKDRFDRGDRLIQGVKRRLGR